MNKQSRLVTYIENFSELEKLIVLKALHSETPVEIIVGARELTRYSKTSLEEMLELTQQAKKNNFEVVLEWDALNQEEKFLSTCSVIDRLPLHDFKAIRVQDPGAVEYIKHIYPWLKIQLILENGNHNLIGLTKWSEYLGKQCERLVLSNELSREMLRDYAKVLTIPLEVLAFGRILLFYSPRKLLSPLEKKNIESKSIEASGSSEESPHSGFPLIENTHGTFMFNVKDLYLLDHLDEIREMGIEHQRVDLRFDESFDNYAESVFNLFSGKVSESELPIRKMHPRPLIKGFYNINKTDVLFTKLKNKRIQRLDQNYLGEIVDVERDQQLALLIKTNGFEMGSLQEIKMITPEGKEKMVQLSWMKSSLGESKIFAQKNDLVLIPYTNGVTVKTQVYLNPKT
ncbi:MAG: U32 family peptidase [Bacteriovorax sp.]|nr:U32 family peptidase [Bacteriovorax sp.]